jgi:hypothetical protein
MMSHRVNIHGRIARVGAVVLAFAAFGAAPQESWETVRSSLPPVGAAPGAQRIPNRAVMPGVPQAIPQPMPQRPGAGGIVPAGNQVPVPPAAMPNKPAATPATSMAMPAPHIPRVPGKIGSVEAIGPMAASAPVALAVPTSTRVYVINGVDPFGWGGLAQMTERIRESGYPDTKFGSWYQILKFDREIRAAHRQDPGAQFVIIGYSFGVYRAKALANRLSRDGIPVAMVGYIGGDYLRNSTAAQQAGGPRVVNVMGDGYLLTGKNLFFNGTQLAGADNVRMPGVRHFSLPKQEQTLAALVNGINSVNGGAWVTPQTASGIAGGGGIEMPPSTTPAAPAASASSPISSSVWR